MQTLRAPCEQRGARTRPGTRGGLRASLRHTCKSTQGSRVVTVCEAQATVLRTVWRAGFAQYEARRCRLHKKAQEAREACFVLRCACVSRYLARHSACQRRTRRWERSCSRHPGEVSSEARILCSVLVLKAIRSELSEEAWFSSVGFFVSHAVLSTHFHASLSLRKARCRCLRRSYSEVSLRGPLLRRCCLCLCVVVVVEGLIDQEGGATFLESATLTRGKQ